MRCHLCGDRKPLDGRGVCRNRAACEHRQLQAEARGRQVDEALARIRFADQPTPGYQVEPGRVFNWTAPEDPDASPWAPFAEPFQSIEQSGGWLYFTDGTEVVVDVPPGWSVYAYRCTSGHGHVQVQPPRPRGATVDPPWFAADTPDEMAAAVEAGERWLAGGGANPDLQ